MKKLRTNLLALLVLILFVTFLTQSNVLAQDPLRNNKYDFIYEQEAQNARLELNHRITFLANNKLDPIIKKAIEVWRQEGNKEKFNKTTQKALANYQIKCAELQKNFEKRMGWAEKNLHANSLDEAVKAEMNLLNKRLKNIMRM